MAGNVKLVVCEDSPKVAATAAQMIATVIQDKANAVVGLATGSTPEDTYSELARIHRDDRLSFSEVTTFNLDEYWGLGGDHDQSYRYFMSDRLFKHIDIPVWNTHVLNGKAVNPLLECQAFETKILASGGIDLWLLGIGTNGHVAFNEPGSAVDSRTRLVNLSEATIEANSDGRFFKNPAEVPRCALSAGIGTIREARQIVLLATGAKKAEAIAAADLPPQLFGGHHLQS